MTPQTQGSSSFHPRAPSNKGPRATYAWERASPRHAYGFETKPPPASQHRYTGQGKPYSGSHYHDVLTGSRRRTEEAEQKLDNLRHEHSMFRAMQLTGLLVLSIGVFGGMIGHIG